MVVVRGIYEMKRKKKNRKHHFFSFVCSYFKLWYVQQHSGCTVQFGRRQKGTKYIYHITHTHIHTHTAQSNSPGKILCTVNSAVYIDVPITNTNANQNTHLTEWCRKSQRAEIDPSNSLFVFLLLACILLSIILCSWDLCHILHIRHHHHYYHHRIAHCFSVSFRLSIYVFSFGFYIIFCSWFCSCPTKRIYSRYFVCALHPIIFRHHRSMQKLKFTIVLLRLTFAFSQFLFGRRIFSFPNVGRTVNVLLAHGLTVNISTNRVNVVVVAILCMRNADPFGPTRANLCRRKLSNLDFNWQAIHKNFEMRKCAPQSLCQPGTWPIAHWCKNE